MIHRITTLAVLVQLFAVLGLSPDMHAQTSVSGIISSNTTWSRTASPYNLTGKVQVSENAVLTIEPGATINGNNEHIEVFGTLSAMGSSSSKITFNNTSIDGSSLINYFAALNVQYAVFKSGGILTTWGYVMSLTLRDSRLDGCSVISLTGTIGTCNSNLERNIFVNSGGIYTWINGNGVAYIRNNVFYQQTSGFAIQNSVSSFTGTSTVAEYNSFLSTDKVAILLPSGSSTAMVSAQNNYWNTSDVGVINSMITDRNDDLQIASVVPYAPFLASPHANTPAFPMIWISQTSLNFGNVTSGAISTKSFRLKNTSNGTLAIASIVSSNPRFSVLPISFNLGAGDSATISVTFSPVTYGAQNGTLTIAHNGENSVSPISVSGTGLASSMSLTSTELTFAGKVKIGQFKDTTFLITNRGNDTLRITNTISSNPVFAARIVDKTLPPSSSFVDTIRYIPASIGKASGVIVLSSNSPSSPDTVKVSGFGYGQSVLSSSTSLVSFGNVKVGQFRDTVVTISNIGNDTLKIISITSSVNAFNARPTARTVSPGQSFSDTIRFVPTAVGITAASIVISSNSSSGADTIKVSGFGYGQGIASIGAPTVLLGNVKVGQYKDTTIVIRNTGNDTLMITSIVSSNLVFAVRETKKIIPPSQSFADTIRFTPAEIGMASALIVIMSNSPSSPDTVKVSGFGYGEATVHLSTSVISFGLVKVWQYKDTLVTIWNQGNDTLKIERITVYGGMFSARPSSGFVLPGKSFPDTIRFSPSTYGNMQATIVVLSNSPSARDTIRVSGVGVAPALKFTVARIDFGLVLLGKSKDTAVTVLNQGNDTLKISSITCKHPAIISTNTSLMIPPGGSAIDTFRFVPQTVGPVLGAMLFVNNGLGTYDTLRVMGSGVTATTGIVQEGIPTTFELKQNYPNPFNPSTVISYSLPSTTVVTVRIFNALGQEIALLVNEEKAGGYCQVTWDANVPSGIYFYRLQAGEFVKTKKMILLSTRGVRHGEY